MARIRFKTIFSRMLFLQCTIMAAVLLLSGLSIGLVVRNQALMLEKDALMKVALEAVEAYNAPGGLQEAAFQEEAGSHGVMVQFVNGTQVLSLYGEEKWNALSGLPKEKTRMSRVLLRASEAPDTTERYFSKRPFPVLTVFCTFSHEGQDVLLLVHGDLSYVQQELGQIALWTLIICLLGVIISFIASYYSAKRIINPFVEMNHTVQCYSKGDFSQRIPITGRDEASQLGRSFNEMAEQLKDLENTRRSFVANVSHELRSPLTSMKGFLEAMVDGTIPPEEHEKYLSLVLSETRRMTVMVNDLLDLARIESGIITVNYDIFDINELVRRTLITFEARISEKNMELDVRFAQEQCFVLADNGQISQVLRNLIDNAIKYSPDNSSITISTYALRKEVYVSIKDTGVGIPAEDVPHVFDRFYKVEKAHTRSPQVGSGLGLAIVKKIIEAHDQSITVKSAKGRGTQFTFTLQRANPLKQGNRGR